MSDAAIFGTFPNREQVEAAIGKLKLDGFRNIDISVLFSFSSSTAAIEGELGFLDRIGVLANPGLGSFIAGGPIMSMLSGTDSVIGGLTGALTRIGMPDILASRCARRIREGSILISVHADDFKWIRKARKVLGQMGAKNIVLTGEEKPR